MKAVKNIRLRHYDYSQDGYCFVTICTNRHRSLSTELREMITNDILNLRKIEGVEMDYFVVMPTHVHLIIVLNDCRLHLGEIVRRFKASSSREAGFKLWQPNYYEHVIRNERALLRIREYVQNNPLKESIDFESLYSV
jgi:putative transposase